MPVRIRAKNRISGTVTPSSLNTETDLINLSDQSDDFILEGLIDLSALASGDTVVIKVYVAADGTNQRLVDQATFNGPLSIPVVRIPAVTLPYNSKPRVTITQTSGTLRSVPYVFIQQIMEVI